MADNLLTPSGGTVQDGEVYGGGSIRQLRAAGKYASARDLHAAQFDEKSQMDAARLSLAQQALLVRKSVAIEAATMRRATLALQYRRNISAAAAIEHLSDLDTTDPSYLKTRAKVMAQYPDALASSAFQNFLKTQDEDHQAFQKSLADRAAATYSGQAGDVWNQTYKASGGNITLANKLAEAEQANVTRAEKIVTDPHLDADTKSQLFDPKSGRFNTDPAFLNTAEVATQTRAAAAKAATDSAGHIGAINTALKAYEDVDLSKDSASLDPVAKSRYATKFNLQEALKNASYNIMQAGKPPEAAAPTATPADTEFQKYLGKPAAKPDETPAPTDLAP